MATIKLSPDDAFKYDQTLADVICFLWGYLANRNIRNEGYDPDYAELGRIMEDLRKLHLEFKGIYKIVLTEVAKIAKGA